MKILIICENYFPSLDATSKRMRTFAECFLKKGHEVHVVASETSLVDKPDKFMPPAYITYYSVFGNQGEHSAIRRLANNLTGVLNSYRAAKKINNCDVVICTSPPLLLSLAALGIAIKQKAKYVFDIRDIWPDIAYEMGSFSKDSIYGKVFEWVSKQSYKKADLITVVSRSKLIKLQNKIANYRKDVLVLVENGLDLDFIRSTNSEACVKKYDLINNPPCVYIGKLGFAQGLGCVLDLAKKRSNQRFLLFGSGAEEKLLQERISNENLSNVKLCGRINAVEAKTVLRHALCALVPLKSSEMKDSVPTKLFEALGCGCPVLLIAQGDSVEILNKCGLGYSAIPEDADGILKAFDAVLSTDWTLEQKQYSIECVSGNYSRQSAAEYLESILVDRFINDKSLY